MSQYRYLIDCNALSKLSLGQRASDFFRENCLIPSEVLHEARWFSDIEDLRAIEYPVSSGVLRAIAEVMATVPDGDIRLVDLYANRGNADPILIACALDGRRTDASYLWASTWIIASDDNAVRAKAVEFRIEVCTSAELIAALCKAEGSSSDGRSPLEP